MRCEFGKRRRRRRHVCRRGPIINADDRASNEALGRPVE